MEERTKRRYRSLTDSEWTKVRIHYENDQQRPSLESLARFYDISESNILKRKAREKWQRKEPLAIIADKALEQNAKDVVTEIAQKFRSDLAKDLQPFLEREKSKHIRSQIKRSKAAFKRLDKLATTTESNPQQFTPKNDAFIAKTADTWDQIMRRNLGLSDGTVPNGALQLNILTNHSAVQIAPRKEP
jgi:hypothetical protein